MVNNYRTTSWLFAMVCFWGTFPYYILGKFSLVHVGGSSEIDTNLAMQHADPSRPYWHVFGVGGLDLQAMGTSYDIPRFLVQNLPLWLGYQIWYILPLWALAWAVYRLARERLNLSASAALFSAFVSILAFEDSNIYLTAIVLAPAFLWLLFRLFDDPRSWQSWIALCVFCCVYALSTVLATILIYPVVFLGLAILVLYRPLRLWHFVVLGFSFVLIYALRFEAIWASIANAPMSIRAYWTSEALTKQYYASGVGETFSAVFNGDGFFPQMTLSMSVFGLVMLIAAWAIPGGTRRDLARISTATALGVAVSLLLPLSVSLLTLIVPAAKGFGADRLGWYVQLFACLGAGMVLERLINLDGKRRIGRLLVYSPVIVGIALSLYIKVNRQPYQWVSEGGYTRVYESPVLQDLARRITDGGTPERTLTYQIFPNNVQTYGIETIGGQLPLYPERYRKYWVKIAEPSLGIDPNFDRNVDYGVYTMLGVTYTPKLKDTSAQINLSGKANLNLVSLANGRYVVSRTKLTDPQLVDLGLGQPEKPWDSLSAMEKVKINVRENFTGRKNLYVYENTLALPRFRLVNEIVTKKSEADVIDALSSQTMDQLRQSVLIDAASSKRLGNPGDPLVSGDVKIVSYTADRIVLDIATAGAAFLVTANSYSRFWKARADGLEVPIVPAYATFWGVLLPSGTKRVVFTYEPPYALFSAN